MKSFIYVLLNCIYKIYSCFIVEGYIEAKIKLPYSYGYFPAFWTWTCNPSYQEIDIFEMTPGDTDWCLKELYKVDDYLHTNFSMTTNIHLNSPSGKCDDPYAYP